MVKETKTSTEHNLYRYERTKPYRSNNLIEALKPIRTSMSRKKLKKKKKKKVTSKIVYIDSDEEDESDKD